jgi:hypothetical protein
VETASSPIFRKRGGGHYLVDIIAGVAVAVGAIVAALAISKRVAPSHAGKSLPIARPHAELVPLRSI